MSDTHYNVRLRRAEMRDVAQMADWHISEIRGGPFSLLGPAFVRGSYRTLLEMDRGVALVAENEGNMAGFVCGVTDTGAFFRHHLLRRGVISALLCLPHILRPSHVCMIVNAAFYPAKFPRELPRAELLSMVVNRQSQGKGIGRILFEEFKNRMSDNGVQSFRITTGENNLAAREFYRRMGCREIAGTVKSSGSAGKIAVFVWP